LNDCTGGRGLGHTDDIAELLRNGNAFLASGKTEQAREVFEKAFRRAREANDIQREMEAGMGMGLSYFVEGQYEKAKKEFVQCDEKKTGHEVRSEIDMVCVYIQFSRMLAHEGDSVAALDWCMRAMNRLTEFYAENRDLELDETIMHADSLLDAAMHMLVEALRPH